MDVQDTLKSMLVSTEEMLQRQSPHANLFEPSQKYGAMEHLSISIDHITTGHLKKLFNSIDNMSFDPRAMNETDNLEYYFAIFRIRGGGKIVAMKRSTHFKSIVNARPRLLQIGPKALEPVTENVFRLDHEFDFIIDCKSVTILFPSGFEQIGQTQNFIHQGMPDAITKLSNSIPFVDFTSISEYIKNGVRGARIVASISMREDLDRIRRNALRKGCERNGIGLTKGSDKDSPKPGEELKFLEYLDGRRYTFDAVSDPTDQYVAQNRQTIKRQKKQE